MSTVDYSDWVLGIHGKVERFTLVFLQLGASNEPARRALVASPVTVQRVTEYLDLRSPIATKTLVLDEVEVLTAKVESSRMGPLRERVSNDLQNDTKVILLSRAPRIAFPDVVGSSLLDDASFAHAPVVKSNGAEEWPTCLEDGGDPETVLRRTLQELGTDLCAALDRALFESQLIGQEALATLSGRELEALDGSSLTSPEASTRRWNFSKHLVTLKGALAEALADDLEPHQQLEVVSAGLWKIERMIRREIRRRAVDAWGENWRTQCLNGDLPGRVIERASESAYLAIKSVRQLRDPLEWLSLGELLQLKDRAEIGDLELGAPLWRQFGVQVAPIRNRLAHMRNFHAQDAATVIKWRSVLESHLRPR